MAEINKNRPEDPARKRRPSNAGLAPGTAPAVAPAGAPSGAAAAAKPPEAGADLGLSDEARDERLGKNGKLKVKLASASGLKAAGKDGKSDPYVEAKLGKKVKKSKACEKTLTPKWDEELELATKLSLKKCIKDGLALTILDKDTGMMDSDDVIGKLTVSLAPLEKSGSASYAESVPEGGVVVFTLEWEEGETVEKKAKKGKEDTPRASASLDTPEKPETSQTL